MHIQAQTVDQQVKYFRSTVSVHYKPIHVVFNIYMSSHVTLLMHEYMDVHSRLELNSIRTLRPSYNFTRDKV